MIELNRINKSYRVGKHKLHVLKDLSLKIGKGELVSVMGPSGSGKSTLLNILGILDDHDSGEYLLGGNKIKKLSEKQAAIYRNQFIGFVFQSFHLLSFKSAAENIMLPLYYRGVKRAERKKLAYEYLERVGLRDWADHLPSELSGGQNQRIAIARALITKPKIILADEPTGNLDSETSAEIMRLFKEVNKEGITVLIVTHDDEVAAQADRTIVLKDGVIQQIKTRSDFVGAGD